MYILTQKISSNKKIAIAGTPNADCIRHAEMIFNNHDLPTQWQKGYKIEWEPSAIKEKMYKGRSANFQEFIF